MPFFEGGLLKFRVNMGEIESQYGRNWVPKTGEIETRFRLFSGPILAHFLRHFSLFLNNDLTTLLYFATLQV